MLWSFFVKYTRYIKQNMNLNQQLYFYCCIVVSTFLTLTIMFFFIVSANLIENQNFFVFAQTEINMKNSTENTLTLATLINQGSPYYGNISSSLVIVDFSDFQCHLCKRYVDNTEQQINSTLIQTGKTIYLFKHLPNRGFDSKLAALAAQCTND